MNVKEKLAKHATHHTAKHMIMMRKLIRDGMSFSDAHRKTQKIIGK